MAELGREAEGVRIKYTFAHFYFQIQISGEFDVRYGLGLKQCCRDLSWLFGLFYWSYGLEPSVCSKTAAWATPYFLEIQFS